MDTMVSSKVGMSEAEWQARCDLAALYRICDLYGWTDTINTHLTARIPGEPKCFLIIVLHLVLHLVLPLILPVILPLGHPPSPHAQICILFPSRRSDRD